MISWKTLLRTEAADMIKNNKPNAMQNAVMRGSLADVSQAISNGESVDSLDREERTPLFYASKDGNAPIAIALIFRQRHRAV